MLDPQEGFLCFLIGMHSSTYEGLDRAPFGLYNQAHQSVRMMRALCRGGSNTLWALFQAPGGLVRQIEGFLCLLIGMYLGTMKISALPVPSQSPPPSSVRSLHSAQIILAFRKKDFYVFSMEIYLGTMKGWIGHYFGHFRVLFGVPRLPGHQSICLTSALS